MNASPAESGVGHMSRQRGSSSVTIAHMRGVFACVAVGVCMAVAATGAAASEYGRCLKVHKGGAYEDANCTQPRTSGKGPFEWFPWGTGKGHQKGAYRAYTNGVQLKLIGGTISCLGENPYSDSFDGEITSPTEGRATFHLLECAGEGSQEHSGTFWRKDCFAGEGRSEKHAAEEMEFSAKTRLGLGAAETEYVFEEPVEVTCLGGEPIEFRFSGVVGGPTLWIAGEMEHWSETALTDQGLQAEWRHYSTEPFQGPVPMEFVDGFQIRAHYREKIEIKAS